MIAGGVLVEVVFSLTSLHNTNTFQRCSSHHLTYCTNTTNVPALTVVSPASMTTKRTWKPAQFKPDALKTLEVGVMLDRNNPPAFLH